MDTDTKNLVAQIDELTFQFRTVDKWQPVRDLVAAQGISPDALLVVGWIDGDEVGDSAHEYGCFVAISGIPGLVISYVGVAESVPRELRDWEEVEDDDVSDLTDDFPAVEIGRLMARGEIPNRWV